MRNLIEDALRSHGADYVDIRIEDTTRTKISLRGRSTDELSVSRSTGGCVRALAGGGWGFVSLNDIVNLKAHVELAVSQARLVSEANGDSLLAPVEPVIDTVVPTPAVDPRSISLAAKQALLQEYSQIMLGATKIQTTTVRYRDTYSKIFASSEGAFIEQEQCDVGTGCIAIAREGDNVQQMFIVAEASTDTRASKGARQSSRMRKTRSLESRCGAGQSRPVHSGARSGLGRYIRARSLRPSE